MDDKQHTIGMTDLLDEVSRDLDDFRKKHAGDYSVKNITLWWELERDRLVARHSPASVVKQLRRTQGLKLLIWFFAGWATMLAADTVIRLLVW